MTAVSNVPLISRFLLSLFLSVYSSPSPTRSTSITISATDLLRARGYSLFASILDRASASSQMENWTSTGTLFAPTDASFSSGIFKNGLRGPPLVFSSFLPYHTTRQPLLFQDLALQPEGSGFATFYDWRCIFICRTISGDLFLAPTKNPTSGYVRIRDPNLFSNGTFIIHGVDGILDPSAASICKTWPEEPPEFEYPRMLSVADFYLGHALQALGENGYNVAATALRMQRSELNPLPGITVFAPADKDVFSSFDGVSYYELRRHVLPSRLAFINLASLPNGTILATMAPGEAAILGTSDDSVSVNGVPIGLPEIYQNEWIVVHPIPRLLPIYAMTYTFVPGDQDSSGLYGGSAPSPNAAVPESPAPAGFDFLTGETPNPSMGIERAMTASAPSPGSLSDSGMPVPSPAPCFPASPISDGFAGATPWMGIERATTASAPPPSGPLSESGAPSPVAAVPDSQSCNCSAGERPAPSMGVEKEMATSAPALAPVLPPSADLYVRARGGGPPSPVF